jgi:hypothetical protein
VSFLGDRTLTDYETSSRDVMSLLECLSFSFLYFYLAVNISGYLLCLMKGNTFK